MFDVKDKMWTTTAGLSSDGPYTLFSFVSRLDNDYGRGFYCTEKIDLAKEWAVADLHDGHASG